MRNLIYPVFISAILLCGGKVYSQSAPVRYSGKIGKIVYYGTGIDANIHIAPSERFLRQLKSGQVNNAQFIVTYHNFPDNAKVAFQYALDIWSSILKSNVPIRVDATWSSTLASGVLGSTSPGNLFTHIPGSLLFNTFYAVSVAEKMVGKELDNTTDPDIVINLNQNIAWYYGTDGAPQLSKYDLVTIVLHEICHGLGFTGSFTVSGTTGSWGFNSPPVPETFDYYVENANGQQLINTSLFQNPSVILKTYLTSSHVYFDGPVERKANGVKAALYAPLTWSSGSSIYHLDFTNTDTNRLMMPSIGTATVIHDPGPIVAGIMGDIGWIHTTIRHDTLHDMETIQGPVTIKATIFSDTLLKKNSLYLYFSTDTFKTTDSIPLISTGIQDEYAADLSIPSLGTKMNYYISTRDTFGRHFTLPSLAPTYLYGFYVGPDTIKPTIQHQSPSFFLKTATSVHLTAVVKDNLGLDTVYMEYRHNNDAPLYIGMHYDSLTSYSVNLPLQQFNLVGGDSVHYRIIAIDSSLQHNVAYSPALGFYNIPVEDVSPPQVAYHNNFNTPTSDFLLDGFSITQPSGFYTPALHSLHPYKSPEKDNAHFDYSALLKVPVIIDSTTAFLRFDEIALVEPGVVGAAFGTADFFDYVAVEGSKDMGTTWQYLADGWDANAYPDWLARWNSKIDKNGNSLATTDMQLYKKRNINMLSNGNFSPGDTILVRFRLYSDPYAWGWGWVIDNLNIQDLTTGTDDIATVNKALSVYPVPATDYLNISFSEHGLTGDATISLFNITGALVRRENISLSGSSTIHRWDVSNLPGGMYFITLTSGGRQWSEKFSILPH